MSHYRSFGLLAILLLVSAGCAPAPTLTSCTAPPPAAGAPQVLLIAREGSADMEYVLTHEVNVMVCQLETAGLKVVVASPSGRPIVGGATTLKPDLKLSDIKVEDYAGFIVPCMAAATQPEPIVVPPGAVEILKKAIAQGKPVAAQQSAVLILGKAGVLDGKQFAIASDYQQAIPGGIDKGTGVVQDGNLITSGSCPYMARTSGTADTTAEITQKFIASVASEK